MGGPVEEVRDLMLQDWDENAVITHARNFTTRYGVEVRCSTRPACAGSATVLVTVACSSIEPLPFLYAIRFDSPFVLSWDASFPFDAIRGDLAALRAGGGQFEGTVETCLLNDADASSLFDATAPGPGEGKYYLVRGSGFTPQCTAHSWSTGLPSEVPGPGGNRDEDLALDPETCP